ncbi:MAG: hypothetical protein ABIH23_10520 [bacterium]
MANKARDDEKQYEPATALATRLRRLAENTIPLAEWQYNAEMGRGHQNVYKSRITGTAIVLTRGAKIPELGSKPFNEEYMPVLPHLVVIGNGITARGNANQLSPEVVAQTTEDQDKDAAKAATLLLRYYDQPSKLNGRLLRKQAVEWLKPCGNVFAQVWWDKDGGEDAPPKPVEMEDGTLAPGEPLMDEYGKPVKKGELCTRILPPHCVLKPPGATTMQELEWIGTQTAMPVSEIQDKFGKKVPAEENLQDLRELAAVDTLNTEGNGQLEDHARVIELYFRPAKKHPKPEQQRYGRHIIVAGNVVLEDGVWEPELTEKFGVWHPFVKCGYIENAGDFWDKSLYDYLVDIQVEINRLFRMMAGARQNTRGVFVYPKGFVDIGKLNLTGHGNGIPELPVEPGASFEPKFVDFVPFVQDIKEQIAFLISQMDDIAAYYEVSRGNPDASVTSGKQTGMLQQASTDTNSPLLGNIASLFEGIWQLQLRLSSIHITEEMKLQIVGEDKEAIVGTIHPDQLKPNDVRVANRAAFFLAPDVRRQYIQENYGGGLYGDPRSPMARKIYADQMDMGDVDGFFDDLSADIDKAKWENNLFHQQGGYMETDPVVLQEIQQEEMAYQQAIHQFEQMAPTLADMAGSQGQPPPMPPQPPFGFQIPFRRARSYDDDEVHIYQHNLERKSPNFERDSQETPEMALAWDFHVKHHEMRMQGKMMQSAPPPQAIPAPPPSASGGDKPPRPGLQQAGPQSRGTAA